jgi:hypothetical protein
MGLTLSLDIVSIHVSDLSDQEAAIACIKTGVSLERITGQFAALPILVGRWVQ